jgi:hypothetical protein
MPHDDGVLASQWPEEELVPPATPATPTGPVSRQFVLAGRAVFTVSNPSGERYTIKVSKVDTDPSSSYYRADRPSTWFVSVLTGPDNDHDYTYVGVLNPRTYGVQLTRKSAYQADSRVYKVVCWALHRIWLGDTVPNGYSILHAGRCGRCGRTLTVPESIRSGFGPECAGKVGI